MYSGLTGDSGLGGSGENIVVVCLFSHVCKWHKSNAAVVVTLTTDPRHHEFIVCIPEAIRTHFWDSNVRFNMWERSYINIQQVHATNQTSKSQSRSPSHNSQSNSFKAAKMLSHQSKPKHTEFDSKLHFRRHRFTIGLIPQFVVM